MRLTRSQRDFEEVVARDPYRIEDLEDEFLLRITRYTIDLHQFQEIKRKIRVDQVKID